VPDRYGLGVDLAARLRCSGLASILSASGVSAGLLVVAGAFVAHSGVTFGIRLGSFLFGRGVLIP
jgi:hypothetical protein